MPLYDYLCRACGRQFELLRRIKDKDQGLQCPDCNSDQVDRIFSTFAAGGCGGAGRFH